MIQILANILFFWVFGLGAIILTYLVVRFVMNFFKQSSQNGRK